MARNNQASIFITAKDKTRDAFNSVNKGLEGVAGKVMSVQGAVLGLVGVGGFGALVNRQTEAGAALAKTSSKLDLQTDKLGQLRYAAELYADVGAGAFDTATQRMTRRVAEAAQGTGEASAALKELGLNAGELVNLTADEKMMRIADAMKDVPNKADRVRLAFKLFDTEGVDLVNMLDNGAEGLRRAGAEADALGLSLNRVEVAKLEMANDAMTKAGKAVEGVGNRIAIGLAPFITVVADRFVGFAKTARLSNDDVSSGLSKVAEAIGFVADTIRIIDYGWTKVKLAFQIMLAESLSGFASLDETVSNFLDKLPGLEMKPSPELKRWALEATAATAGTFAELDKLTSAPMPSEKVKALFKDITDGAQKAALEMAAAANADIGKSAGMVVDVPDQKAQQEAEKQQKIIDMHAAKFARLAEMAEMAALDDEDRARAEMEKKLAALEEEKQFLLDKDAWNLEREQAYIDARAGIVQQGEAKLYDIRQKAMTNAEKFSAMSWGKQVQTVAGALMQMTAGAADSNRAMFEVNKAAAIANAIVTGIAGVQRAFMDYPFPVSGIIAAATAAATVANVAKIASTSFGSKSAGGAASAGGGVPSNATSPGAPVTQTPAAGNQQQAQQQPMQVQVHLHTLDPSAVNDDALLKIGEKLAPILQANNDAGMNMAVRA